MVEAFEMGTSLEITKLLLGLICGCSSASYRSILLKFIFGVPTRPLIRFYQRFVIYL